MLSAKGAAKKACELHPESPSAHSKGCWTRRPEHKLCTPSKYYGIENCKNKAGRPVGNGSLAHADERVLDLRGHVSHLGFRGIFPVSRKRDRVERLEHLPDGHQWGAQVVELDLYGGNADLLLLRGLAAGDPLGSRPNPRIGSDARAGVVGIRFDDLPRNRRYGWR